MFDIQVSSIFPNLQPGEFYETSPKTEDYNCIAWAADDQDRWWWPDPNNYWPQEVLRVVILDAFIEAFRGLRYEPCMDGSLEEGFEKVVIYVKGVAPTHAARQLSSGWWTSKLGREWDIVHKRVEDVEGAVYGQAAQFMRRPRDDE